MKRYTVYDEETNKYYVVNERIGFENSCPGDIFHDYSFAHDKLGELEDFMEENGFETVEDLKTNYELKRLETIRTIYEEVIEAYVKQHKNDLKELDNLKKSFVRDVELLIKEVIQDVKRFYRREIDKGEYVKLKSVLGRLGEFKCDFRDLFKKK